jgi:mono/diheme cytochrome c family protein/glucose/arabinose dehydrogenase
MRFGLALLIVTMIACPAWAQRGDKKGQKQAETWKQFNLPKSPPLKPADALKSFKIAPGFKLELFASEPLVVDPVAVAWDGDGRAYVVEMRGYMPNVDGKGETDLKNGQVVVLEDTDWDGKADKKTVFLDGLVMPRAISMVQGGVLISEPDKLWYCQDTNGDLKCDKKINVAKYARQGPVEHTENGLMPAMDNWIYNAKSGRRFKFKHGKITESKTQNRGQWGINQDDYGRLYYTTNSRWLSVDWLTHYNVGRKYNNGPIRTSEIFSIRPNPGINRGYQSNMLKKDGRLARVTAISGPGVYRSNRYGKALPSGTMFIAEPAANAVGVFTMTQNPGGLAGKHVTVPDKKWQKREFLCSTDERFRPVTIYNGPDGCIWVVDMYRGILQHRVYVTTFLRKQILERELDQPVGLGRIYRIVSAKGADKKAPKMQTAPSSDLVANLSHENGWWRDTAQRLLVERNDASVVGALQKLVTGSNHLASIHALWTLEGMNALDEAIVSAGLKSRHPKVRIAALAVSDRFKSTAAHASVAKAAAALESDSDSEVKSLATHMAKVFQGTAPELGITYPKLSPPAGAHGASVTRGFAVYKILCVACHFPHGKGAENVAPPLDDSDWVKGSTKRLIRIVLHGVSGPIQVNGKQHPHPEVMPGQSAILKDPQIADVLSFVRWTWGKKASAVSVSQVTAIRAATKSRTSPWLVEELKKIQ